MVNEDHKNVFALSVLGSSTGKPSNIKDLATTGVNLVNFLISDSSLGHRCPNPDVIHTTICAGRLK